MADSHPFSNAGLGMFGAGESFAKSSMTPPKGKRTLTALLGIMGFPVPEGGTPAPTPAMPGLAPIAPPTSGNQPLALPAVPNGIGIKPYDYKMGLQPSVNPFAPTMAPRQQAAATVPANVDLDEQLASQWQ